MAGGWAPLIGPERYDSETVRAVGYDLLDPTLLQSLAAAERKNRRYEDGALPPWVVDWKQAHPDQWAKVEEKLSTEPRPAKKIPKGREMAGTPR